jgi:hypothetical protein
MTMRKPKRKRELVEQGEPGKRGHKLLRKHQDNRGSPRHARPFEPRAFAFNFNGQRYSRFK